MQLDEILHWCIFRSKGRTAKSAAEELGIHPVQFGNWRNHVNTHKFPTDEQCVKIAELVALDPFVVWLAVQSEKTRSPAIRERLKSEIKPAFEGSLDYLVAQELRPN